MSVAIAVNAGGGLIYLLHTLDASKIKGTLTVAFVTQQWLGARGLQKILNQLNPDELIYVGRLMRPAAAPAANAQGGTQREAPPSFKQPTGSGVIIASEKPEADLTGFAAELKHVADETKIPVATDLSAPLLPRGGYMAQPKLPAGRRHAARGRSSRRRQ